MGFSDDRTKLQTNKSRPSETEDTMTQTGATQQGSALRPFRANVPETELTELRRHINATRLA
jgi:hypothetical protein